ncbi:hypothetical protein AB0P12_13930 [Streptomyces subrutilus]|uniref:hypothetical protein n=1 Tax=Streptomyces subrutilus TaxID=36818 RepID=UPI002E153905|nr:hypothetical protein OG479_01755 [Streptomyces subrutilus]
MIAVSKTARRAWLAGGLALPMALGLTSVSAPAMAAPGGAAVAGAECAKTLPEYRTGKAKPGKRPAAKPVRANDGCTGTRGPQGSKGPKGDRGPAGPCVNIDTVPGAVIGSEYSAALTRGKVFAGYRASATSAYTWRDLTRAGTPGYPRNACGVAVKLDAGRVYVKVLTTAGDIYETSCTVTLSCTVGWSAVVRP